MDFGAYQIMAFGVILVIGIAMFASVTAQSNTDVLNNYTLNFTENPHDGDTVNVDSHIFEFDNDNNYTGIPVNISSTANLTAINLKQAINNNTQVIAQ